jgi:flagellin-like protein
VRRALRGRRGLAEIVGTLMLVLIVVAAAIGFSLFLASEQQRLQTEEAAHELKKLEGLKVVSISAGLESAQIGEYVSIDFTSLDINSMTISGITINDAATESYTLVGPAGFGPLQCFLLSTGSPSGCPSLLIPGLSQATIAIPYSAVDYPGNAFTLSNAQTIQVSFFTVLGNEFTEVFIPPVAEPTLSYVGDSPLLNGVDSYQPVGSTDVINASIDSWSWDVQRMIDSHPMVGDLDNGVYYGQEAVLPVSFVLGGTYDITLTVSNTFGLTGTSTIVYVEPPPSAPPTTYALFFNETGLPPGTFWSVGVGDATASTTGSSVEFEAPNGTYDYTVTDVAGWHQSTIHYRGSVTISGSHYVEPPLAFIQVTYLVTFKETGLPASTLWSVILGGVNNTTTGSANSFSEPNGTYRYLIDPVPGWEEASTPSSGLVVVDGMDPSTLILAYTQSP